MILECVTAACLTVQPPDVPEQWARLADCETGDWIGDEHVDGSARWRWGDPDEETPPWGGGQFHGGLQFYPDTWTWLRPEHYPEQAWQATPEQQVAVAERVLATQGWQAWPVCSRRVGLDKP